MSVRPKDKTPEAPDTPANSGRNRARTDDGLADYYNELLNEPIPDRFKELLKQLEAKEKK